MAAHCRTRLASRLSCLTAVGLAAAAQAQLYSESFDVDTTGTWHVNTNPASPAPGDVTAEFFFDYGSVGIPEAPNSPGGSTATRGMKLQANLTSSTLLGAVSVSPMGVDLSAAGDFTMTFDVWSNFNGPFPGGGSGSTNLSTYGILTSGTSINRPGVADSVWFAHTGDGGSSADWRIYSAAQPASHQQGDPAYVDPSRNHDGATYQVFGGVMAPAAQVALFPQQSGTTLVGSGGMDWHEVEVIRTGNFVIWRMDGTLLGVVDTSAMALGGGNILFGHSDINGSSSADPNRFDLLFTLVDNVRVVSGVPVGDPTGACCQPIGTCSVVTQVDCLLSGGTYQGDGTPCSMGLCPPTAGACCLNDGTCIDNVDEAGCTAMAGVFNGLGSTCASIPPCPDVRPANDECATAQAITLVNGAASVLGDTFTATLSGSPGCLGVTDGSFGDVWYTVTGTGARMIATTCPGAPAPSPATQFADFNSQIRVYTGTCGALVCEAANFDAPGFGCNTEFRVAWDTVLGETYYILVSGFALDPGGMFEMAVFEDATGACCFADGTCADLTSGDCGLQGGVFNGFQFDCATFGNCPVLIPPNDDCATASPVVVGGTVFQSNEFSEGDDAESECADSSDDLWWSFTPSVSGPYTIDTISTTGFNDTVLDIFIGCGGPLLFCDDDGAGVGFHAEAKDIFLVAGTNYRIRVASWGNSGTAVGDVGLFVSVAPFPEGACCNGTTCAVMDETSCLAGGGTYLGDFVTCGENDLDLRDDGSALAELPFTFNFFGQPQNDVVVSANGYLTFKDDGSDGSNNAIPSGANPFAVIAPLWDDFDPAVEPTASVRADTRGTGAGEHFIAQWTNVPQFGNTDSFTFQAVLFQDGSIEFRYGDIVPEAIAGDYTVGLQNPAGTGGVIVDSSTVDDGDCIRFVPDGLGGYTQSACANALEDITVLVNPCDAPPPVCVCELDGNAAQVNVFDLLAFLDLWFANAPGADIDGDPGVDVFDLLAFLDCWFPASAGAPCP